MATLLAHEWLSKMGGSENVFEQIRRVHLDSRAVCLWNDDPVRFPGVEESWIAHTLLRGHKAASLPFMAHAWRSVGLEGVDRVIASSHAFSHHLAARAAKAGVPAYAYVHSPARYIWDPRADPRAASRLAGLGRSYFRKLDRRSVSAKVHYAANSEFVARRVFEAWGMPAQVIYPPVQLERIRGFLESRTLNDHDRAIVDDLPSEFVLGASRFVPYKRLESAIQIGALLDLPVVLVGEGPDENRLRAIAGEVAVPVTLVRRASDSLLWELFSRTALYVFMAVEDFGIMPVEAVGCGAAILVNESGGASESMALLNAGAAVDPLASKSALLGAANEAMARTPPELDRAESLLGVARFRREIARWTDVVSSRESREDP